MEKKQGSMQIETSEGGGDLQIEVTGERIGLPTMLAGLKQKLKDYGLKDFGKRKMVLTLFLEAAPEEDNDETRAKNAEKYPDTKSDKIDIK